jgi:hypothetical protein
MRTRRAYQPSASARDSPARPCLDRVGLSSRSNDDDLNCGRRARVARRAPIGDNEPPAALAWEREPRPPTRRVQPPCACTKAEPRCRPKRVKRRPARPHRRSPAVDEGVERRIEVDPRRHGDQLHSAPWSWGCPALIRARTRWPTCGSLGATANASWTFASTPVAITSAAAATAATALMPSLHRRCIGSSPYYGQQYAPRARGATTLGTLCERSPSDMAGSDPGREVPSNRTEARPAGSTGISSGRR